MSGGVWSRLIMEGGEDENETRAACMDGWIAWEHEEREEGS
jgi:hypothetical protein